MIEQLQFGGYTKRALASRKVTLFLSINKKLFLSINKTLFLSMNKKLFLSINKKLFFVDQQKIIFVDQQKSAPSIFSSSGPNKKQVIQDMYGVDFIN
jgi:hypothetical protein